MPRLVVNSKNASVELLTNYIQSYNVGAAIETWKLLEEKGVSVDDSELKQQFLQLICYHNESDAMEDEDRDIWGVFNADLSWDPSGEKLAEKLVNDLSSDHEDQIKAQTALLCAFSKYDLKSKISFIKKTYKDLKDSMDVTAFNFALLVSSTEEEAESVLRDMKHLGVKPNEQTLCNYLKVINATKGGLNKALSALNEFKNVLGIEPSLGSFVEVAKIGEHEPHCLVIFDLIAAAESTVLQPKIQQDFAFFSTAMSLVTRKERLEWVYRLHELAIKNPVLMGDFKQTNAYYNEFFSFLIHNESMDVAMDYYNQMVPHTWYPPHTFYLKLLQVVAKKDGYKHIGKIWTDLQAGRFGQIRIEGRMVLYSRMLATMTESTYMQDRDDEQEVIFKTWVAIAVDLFVNDILVSMPGGKRRNALDLSNPTTIAVLDGVLNICSSRIVRDDGEMAVANVGVQRRVVELCYSNSSHLSGCLRESTLQKCLGNCFELKDKKFALAIVAYAVENRCSTAHDMAMELVKTLENDLEEVDRTQLNNLFSYETKWTPL